MYLVIAEKPSVAASIAKVLGADKRQDGYIEGPDCYVSWCLGHLMEYSSPEGYDEKYSRWIYEDLPIIPEEWKLVVSDGKREQFNVVRKLLNSQDIDYVVNACDAGREGELIFRHVYDQSGSHIPVKRLWISSLEDAAIVDGFAHLRNGNKYDYLADSARARSQADWLVGMNATRAYTTKYYKKLTIGRVQTPTLAMLVERDQAISSFKKEKYYNLSLDCDGVMAVKQKIFDEAEAVQLQKICQGNDAKVDIITATDKVRKTPKLYDLTTLQRDANRRFGFTAQQTLNIAQSLYEQKLITYPRTDSQYLTEDMEATAESVIRQIHAKYQPLGPFAQPGYPDVSRVMNNKKVSDHHAIIPTMEIANVDLGNLKNEEQQILFLISIRLLEGTDKDHIFTETEVKVLCEGQEFIAKGKQIKQLGWLVYENCFKNSDDVDDKEKILPKLREGQTFSNIDASLSDHFTSPPKAYTEDTLLAAMETAGNKEFDENTEKKGLGTPATRASIIEKLVHSQYATRRGKQIVPTEDGKVLIEILPDFLKSASMTAEWENQLMQIERGQIPARLFMNGIKNMLTMMLNGCELLSEDELQRFQTRESIGACPVCGALVYESKKNFYCSNRECSFTLWKENRYLERMRKHIDAQLAAQLLKNGRARVRNLYSVKKDAYFEADLLIHVQADGRVQFAMEFPKNNGNNRKKK